MLATLPLSWLVSLKAKIGDIMGNHAGPEMLGEGC